MRRRPAIAIALTLLILGALLQAPAWLAATVGRFATAAAAEAGVTLDFERVDTSLPWGVTLRGVRIRRGDVDVNAESVALRWLLPAGLTGAIPVSIDLVGLRGALPLTDLTAVAAPSAGGGPARIAVRSVKVDADDLRVADLPYGLPDTTITALATLPAPEGAWRVQVEARTRDGAMEAIVSGRFDHPGFDLRVLRADARIARHWWDGALGGTLQGDLTWGDAGADGAFTLDDGALVAFGEHVDGVHGPLTWRGDRIDLAWRGVALGGTIDVVGVVDVAAARWQADAGVDVAAERATAALWRTIGATALPPATGVVTARVSAEGWTATALRASVDLDGAWLGAPIALDGIEIAYATGRAVAYAGAGSWGEGSVAFRAEPTSAGSVTTANATRIDPWGIPIEAASGRFVATAAGLIGEAEVAAGDGGWRVNGTLVGGPDGWRSTLDGDAFGVRIAGALAAPRLQSDAPLSGRIDATTPWGRATADAAGVVARPLADVRLAGEGGAAALPPGWAWTALDLSGGGGAGWDERGPWLDLRFGPLAIVGAGSAFTATLAAVDVTLPGGAGGVTLGPADLTIGPEGLAGQATATAAGPGWRLSAPLRLEFFGGAASWSARDPTGTVSLAGPALAWRILDLPLTLLGAPATLSGAGQGDASATIAWSTGRIALRAVDGTLRLAATTGDREALLSRDAAGWTLDGAVDLNALPGISLPGWIGLTGGWANGEAPRAEGRLTLTAPSPLAATLRTEAGQVHLRTDPSDPFALSARWGEGDDPWRDEDPVDVTLAGFPPRGAGVTAAVAVGGIGTPAAPWRVEPRDGGVAFTWGESVLQAGAEGIALALDVPLTWGEGTGRITGTAAWRPGSEPTGAATLDTSSGAAATAHLDDGRLTATLDGPAAGWLAALHPAFAPDGVLAAAGSLQGEAAWTFGTPPTATLVWLDGAGVPIEATWQGGAGAVATGAGWTVERRSDGSWRLEADAANVGDLLAAQPTLRLDGEATLGSAGVRGAIDMAIDAFGVTSRVTLRDADLAATASHPLGTATLAGVVDLDRGVSATWRANAAGALPIAASGSLTIGALGWAADGDATVAAGSVAGFAWPTAGATFRLGSGRPLALTPTGALRGGWPEGFTLTGAYETEPIELTVAPHDGGARVALLHADGRATLTGSVAAWEARANLTRSGIAASVDLRGTGTRGEGGWQLGRPGTPTPLATGPLALDGGALGAAWTADEATTSGILSAFGAVPTASNAIGDLSLRIDGEGIAVTGRVEIDATFDEGARARAVVDADARALYVTVDRADDAWRLDATPTGATLTGPADTRLDASWGTQGIAIDGAILGVAIAVTGPASAERLHAHATGGFGRVDLSGPTFGPYIGVFAPPGTDPLPLTVDATGVILDGLTLRLAGGGVIVDGTLRDGSRATLTARDLAWTPSDGFAGDATLAGTIAGMTIDATLTGAGDLVVAATAHESEAPVLGVTATLERDLSGGDLAATATWAGATANGSGAFTLTPLSADLTWAAITPAGIAGTIQVRGGAAHVTATGGAITASGTLASGRAAVDARWGDARLTVDVTDLHPAALKADLVFTGGAATIAAVLDADLPGRRAQLSARGPNVDARLTWHDGVWAGDGRIAWGGIVANLDANDDRLTLSDDGGAWRAAIDPRGRITLTSRLGIVVDAAPSGLTAADATIATPWGDGTLRLTLQNGRVHGVLVGGTPLGPAHLDLTAQSGPEGLSGTLAGGIGAGEIAWPWGWSDGLPTGEGWYRAADGIVDDVRWRIERGPAGAGLGIDMGGRLGVERWTARASVNGDGAVVDAAWHGDGFSRLTLRGRAWPTLDLLASAGDGGQIRVTGAWRDAPLAVSGDLQLRQGPIEFAVRAPGRLEIAIPGQGGLQALIPTVALAEMIDDVAQRGLLWTGTGGWRGEAILRRDTAGWEVNGDLTLTAFGVPVSVVGTANPRAIDAAVRVDPTPFAAALAAVGFAATPIDLRAEWSSAGASLVGTAPWGIAAFLDPTARTAGIALDVDGGAGATVAGVLRHGPGGWSGEVHAAAHSDALGNEPTTLEATLRGIGSLLTLDLTARGGRGSVTGRGAWDGAALLPRGWALGPPRSTLDLRLLGLDLNGIAGFDVAGRLDGSATIRDGEAIGRLVSEEFRVGTLRDPLTLEFVGSVPAATLDARLDLGGLAATAALDRTAIEFVAQLDRFALHDALVAVGAPGEVTAEVSGVVRGGWRWGAPLPHDLRLASERVRLARGEVITEGEVAAAWDGTTLTISRFAFQGRGSWEITGRAGGDVLDLTFRADDADFSPLLALIPNLARYGVVASGDLLVEARGSLANPNVIGRSAALEVGIAGTRTRLEGAEVTLQGETWSGSALLTGIAPLNGRLALVSEGRVGAWPSGDFRVDLRAAGALEVPYVGAVDGVDATLRLARGTAPTLAVSGVLGAPFEIAGTLAPLALSGRGIGLRLGVPFLAVAEAVVDADLTLRADRDGVHVGGRIDASQAQVAPSVRTAGATGGPASVGTGGREFVHFDGVRIVAPQRVSFAESFGNAEAAVDLTLDGTAAAPRLSGTIQTLRADLRFAGRDVAVTEAVVTFDPTRGVRPTVRIVGFATFEQSRVLPAGARFVAPTGDTFDVWLTLTGEASDALTGFVLGLTPSFTSDALIEGLGGASARRLTDLEMIALMTLGRIEGVAGAVAQSALDAAVDLFVTGELQTALADALGIDVVELRTSAISTLTDREAFGVSLRLGGYLSEEVFASYRVSTRLGGALSNEVALAYAFGALSVDVTGRVDFTDAAGANPGLAVAARYALTSGMALEVGVDLGNDSSTARLGVSWRW